MMIMIESLMLIVITLGFISFPYFYFSDNLVAVEETKDNTTFVRRSSKIINVFNKKSEKAKSERGLCSKIVEVLCNKLFFFTTFARIVLLGLNSVLILWLPSYMDEVLNITNRRERLSIYATLLFCSPIIGGVLCHSITLSIDGYESQSAFVILLIINVLSTCAFVAVPYVTEWYYFALFVMIYKIGINTIVPILNGIILTSMPLELKAISFTISALSNVFFGFGFSAPLYGLIYSYTKVHSKTFALKCFTFSSIFSVFWLLIATITRHIQDAQAKSYRLSQTSKESMLRSDNESYNSSHVSNDLMNDEGQLQFDYESNNSDADVILNLVDFK